MNEYAIPASIILAQACLESGDGILSSPGIQTIILVSNARVTGPVTGFIMMMMKKVNVSGNTAHRLNPSVTTPNS